MPGILRLKPHPPEDSVTIRVATLVTVLIAVGAVAIHEEFLRQAGLAASAIGVGFWVSYRRRRSRNWWLKTAIALLVLLAMRDFFLTLVADPYDPRVALVQLFLWLQALHSFDLPARKDLKYSLASAVVLMAVAAVYARAAAFGLLLMPFAVAGTTAAVAMTAGERFPLRPRALPLVGLWLGVVVMAGAAVAFAAIPHGQGLRVRWLPVSPKFAFATKLHGRIVNPAYPETMGNDPEQAPPVFNPQGYVGFSTYVDLRLRGTLADTLVMRIRTTRPAFWRGLAFDVYTGRGWRMSDQSVEEYTSDQPRIVPRFGQDEPWPAGSEQVVQTFYIEAVQPNVIFAAYRPFEVYFPTASLAVDRYAALRSPVRLEPGMIYSVISRVPAPTPLLLRRSPAPSATGRGSADIPEGIRQQYLALPRMSVRVYELAHRLTAGRNSAYDMAVAVNQYLIRDYSYSLQAPLLPEGGDAVDDFLFKSKEGSCEAFASAMAVLLRAAGVPTRLVTGYTTGSYNIFTGYYEVRNSDAHAWVEVFIPGVGWIEFEATPGFAAPENLAAHSSGQWLARDVATWMWNGMRRAAAPVLAWAGAVRAGPPGALDPASGALAVLVLALVLVRRRRTAADAWEDAGDVQGLYGEMPTHLARRGFAREPAITPREFVADVPPLVREPVQRITEVFEESRYARRPVRLAREAAARRAYDDLLAQLRDLPRKMGR